jgi:hypothetical protein
LFAATGARQCFFDEMLGLLDVQAQQMSEPTKARRGCEYGVPDSWLKSHEIRFPR